MKHTKLKAKRLIMTKHYALSKNSKTDKKYKSLQKSEPNKNHNQILKNALMTFNIIHVNAMTQISNE